MSNNKEQTKLQGAVLIIGSLLWENEDNAISKEIGVLRNNWREKYLDFDKAETVKCPIRYGRTSSTRHHTYTMLFSNNTPAIGSALIVPFKETISINDGFGALENQAFALAEAEQICKPGEVNLFKDWGTVAIKTMPQLSAKNPTIASSLTDWWAKMFKGYLKHKLFRINGTEETSVTDDGFINFNIEISNPSIDYLLCTPTAPNVTDYPSAFEIAQLISKAEYSTYFIENISHKIRTFQDEEVKQLLSHKVKSKLPPKVAELMNISNYNRSNEGLFQFQKDLMIKLGDMLFVPSKTALCFHILKSLDYTFENQLGMDDANVRANCQNPLQLFKEHFGDYEIALLEEKPDLLDKLLFHFLNLEKLPGTEKQIIEKQVKEDLKKRTDLINRYEQNDFIKDFKQKKITPRNQEENTLHDFYIRNLNEQQTIIDYFFNHLDKRVVSKCNVRYLTHINYFDWYYDRPYRSSIPNSEGFFDHKLIDKCGHRLASVRISEANRLKELYGNNKKEFYTQLESHVSKEAVFHEIKYYISFLPVGKVSRKDLFEELIVLFKEQKWFGFYGLALTQIEGLFSEMADSIEHGKRLPSLPDKVETVRPYYEFSDQRFDYYQYCVPLLRNKFMHSGIDEEIEIKSYEILYDVHHLLKVFAELETPSLKINTLIKRSDPMDFLDIKMFNSYFDLLDKVKASKNFDALKALVDTFERDFLCEYCNLEYISNEAATLLRSSFEHWYNTILHYTDINKIKKDLRTTTPHNIRKHKQDYSVELLPIYRAYKDIFDNLLDYHSFLSRYHTYLPSIKEEPKAVFKKMLKDYKDDFEKLKLVLEIINE